MKTKATLLMVLLACCGAMQAQSKNHFGLRAAMNIAGISGLEPEGGYTRAVRLGFAGGLFFNHELTKQASVHAEALYNNLGVELENDDQPDLGYRLDYVSVPIMYRYHFNEKEPFSVQVGVQPGFLINKKIKVWGADGEEVVEFDEFYEGQDAKVNSFDMALIGGLGFGFGKFSSLTITYTYGITEIFKGQDALANARHSYVQFGLSIPLSSNTY